MSSKDIKQIKVGDNRVGIIGLKQILEEIAEESERLSETEIRELLIGRLEKRNYIAPKVRDKYEAAFYREFCRYTGRPYEAPASSGALEIKILGRGCFRCDQLKNDMVALVSEMQIPAEIEHIHDLKEISTYGVLGSPGLVINGEVKAVGKIPSKEKIREWIKTAMI